jgi:ABC-type iron transport system FetAB ATPase subunit
VRINGLAIHNLRAIRNFVIEDLKDFIVIAGQNGSGKSCIFDAIRLLKSVYGGQAPNEYHQWFGEFQINIADPESVRKLFRNPASPVNIEASISFDDSEIVYLTGNLDRLVQPIAWQQVTGQPVDAWAFSSLAVATQLRTYQPQLVGASERIKSQVGEALLTRSEHRIAVNISPNGDIETADCPTAEVAFSAYAPDRLGVIEYHSASRSYPRQALGGINLDTRAFEDQQRQQRLYNWQNKYQNIKTELASSYLRSLIRQASEDDDVAAQHEPGQGEDLNETLIELFNTFFPDKSYLGVRPLAHGSLEFPVQLSSGEIHDIDDLSSGEKEILYGYLKLKNGTPRHSILLLDEPELHMNPSLLHGLADFYFRHLGVAQHNQLWMVTHSDTLLRQAVGNTDYRVYQMLPGSAVDDSGNQATEVLADDDVERATISLVGDLAAYRPHGKVVILEGISEDGFDVAMVRRLFPDFARRVNLVGGGSKRRVRDLFGALREAADQAGLRNRFFCIVDADTDKAWDLPEGALEYAWDAYHIENYLLDPESVRRATSSLLRRDVFASDEDAMDALKDAASALTDRVVLQVVQNQVNNQLTSAIKVGAPTTSHDPAADLIPSIQGSLTRFAEVGGSITLESLGTLVEDQRSAIRESLASGEWIRRLPGRWILAKFVAEKLEGRVDAEIFRNMVLDRMAEMGKQPPPMRSVLDTILST